MILVFFLSGIRIVAYNKCLYLWLITVWEWKSRKTCIAAAFTSHLVDSWKILSDNLTISIKTIRIKSKSQIGLPSYI